MKELRVRLEHDPAEKVWYASAEEDERLHTFGRSVTSALDHFLDAAALWHEMDPEEIQLIPLPPVSAKTADLYKVAVEDRGDLRRAQINAAKSTGLIVHRLSDEGYSLRDIASLLDISYQRVQQLLNQPSSRAS